MLSRPSFAIWIISTLMVALVIAAKYFAAAGAVPVAGPIVSQHVFEFLLLGYVLLWIGTVFRRI